MASAANNANVEVTPKPKPKFIQILESLENWMLTGVLILMLGLACLQIILRNFFDSGIVWGDSLLRIAVLWVALLGAMVASREGNHINIDLFTRWINPQHHWLITSITALFTAAICFTLAYHSYRFLRFEYEDGFLAFATVPNWVCELIMPIAFATIALRYLAILAYNLRFRSSAPPAE